MCRALRYSESVCVLIHQHNMPRNWCPILSGCTNFSFQYVNLFLACFAFAYNLFCDAKMKLFFLNCQIFFRINLKFIFSTLRNISKINGFSEIKKLILSIYTSTLLRKVFPIPFWHMLYVQLHVFSCSNIYTAEIRFP